MAYVDSSGKTHVSLSEATRGYTAQTTASRNTAGQIVGSSSGSNYAREQEEQARAAAEQASVRENLIRGTPAWATAPGETAGIDRSQLQKFRTVDQINEEQGTISRTLSAFKQGYGAGKGKEFSLEGLKAPVNRAQDMAMYPFYEKTTALAGKYDSLQNSALSRVPAGLGKDVITGVSNIPEIAIGTIGAVPLGLESMARNPTSISDSIGFGLGAIAGATVQKAQTHPGELAGELIGSWALAKAGGSLEVKARPGFSSKGLKDFSFNERASLGTQKLVYREPSLKSLELPQLKQEMESYVAVGDNLIPESMTKINRVTLGDDVVLTSEMEEVLFGKSSITAPEMDVSRLDTLLKQDIFSPEMTAPSKHMISSIQAPEFAINSIKAVEFEGLMSRSQAVEVGGLMNRSQAVEVGGLMNRSSGIVIPSLAYSLPFAGQGLSLQGRQVQQQETKSSFMAVSIPSISFSSSLAEDQVLQDITIGKEKNTNALYIPQLPDISPIGSHKADPIFIPDTFPDIPPGNIPDNPWESDGPGWDTPLPWGKVPPKKPVFALDDSLSIVSESSKPKRRKTKQKQTKNLYGDPFNIKLKL